MARYALTMLRLRLVGEIAAEVDGDSRPLPPGRPRGLLAWLALRPGLQPRSRRRLASSGPTCSTRAPAPASAARSGPSAARSARRRSSRRAIASALAADAWVDVLEAERLRAEGRCDEALALVRRRVPPGLDEEWALDAQDEHRERLVALLEELAAAAARDGDLRRAVALTRRQAALEPLSEEIHRGADAPARRSRRPGRRARRVHRAPQPPRHPAPNGAVARDAAARRRAPPEASPRRLPRSRFDCSAPTGQTFVGRGNRARADRRSLAPRLRGRRRGAGRPAGGRGRHRQVTADARFAAEAGPRARRCSTARARNSRSSPTPPSRRRSAAKRRSGRRSRRT